MNTRRKLIAAMSLCAAIAVSNIAPAVAVSGQGTWESTLQGRDLDGNLATAEAYYDTVLGITWLADADYASTSGFASSGLLFWTHAKSWAQYLDPYSSGITGWRLPTTNPVDGTTADDLTTHSYIGTEDKGWDISAPGTLYAGSPVSEMAYMFYNTLGNKGLCDPLLSSETTCSFASGDGLTKYRIVFQYPSRRILVSHAIRVGTY